MSTESDFLNGDRKQFKNCRTMQRKTKLIITCCKILGIAVCLPVLLWGLSAQMFVPGGQYVSQENIYRNWYAVNRKPMSALLPVENQLPIIYAITPTYYRLTQRAELTRLSQTLKLVRNLHWIVVEDNSSINKHVQELLESSGVTFTYLSKQRSKTTSARLKGVDQRNEALKWLMKHHKNDSRAVVYFADDDNAYSTKIFEEMRYTKKLSMWPVGFSGGRTVETPIIKNGKVIKFEAWKANTRKFGIDMAGFAINVKVLWDFHPMLFSPVGRPGQQETAFLEQCCTLEDIEPLADNCTKVLVWHTKTQKPHIWAYGDLEV